MSSDTRFAGMRNVWILTACMTSMSICYTMLVPFLPVYLLDIGATDSNVAMWSGIVFSITFLIAGIMAPIWGKLADNKGKKMMAIRAAFFIGIAYVLTGLVTNPWQLMLTRAFQGFANGFMPAAMTMVSLSVPKQKVGPALGIFQTGLIVGNVIGPLVGGLVEAVIGMRPVFYFAGVVLFIVSIVTYFWVDEPTVITEEGEVVGNKEVTNANGSIIEDFKIARQNDVLIELLGLFFIMQAAILMLQPILTLYIGELQGSMVNAAMVSGTILSVGGVAGVVTTNLWSHFGQRKGYFKAISYAITGTGIFLFCQSFPLGIWYFGILQVLVGCCIVGVNPSLSAAVADCTDADFRGRVFGMATTAQQFGSMVGPLFASAVTAIVGIRYVFLITGVMLVYVGYRVYNKRVKEVTKVVA